MSLALLRTRLERLVSASLAAVPDLGVDEHLEDAALVYSRCRPRLVVADLAATGEWLLALPQEWEPDFSAVRHVEYPLDRRPHSLLGPRQYSLYHGPEGARLALQGVTPAAGEVVRVTVSAPHTLAEASTSLPRGAWQVVVMLAASTVCLHLATYYGHKEDATHGLDSVDHGGRSGGPGADFAKRARDFRALAESELPELKTLAGGEVSLAPEMAFLTHR